MLLVIGLFVIITGIVVSTSNADTFSPSKFLLAFYCIFHLGALFDPPETLVLALMLMPLLLIFILAFTEAALVQYKPPVKRSVFSNHPTAAITAVIWLCSSPAVLSQLVMIYEFGGLVGYFNSVGSRVADWSGFGWARTLIATLSGLNIAYFAVGLSAKRSFGWWGLYVVHLSIVLTLGVLSGSRSGLLNVFAIMLVSFHYLRRPVSMPAAGGMVVLLSATASILGVARNGFKIDNGELSTGLSSSTESFSMNAFSYGIDPLQLIVDAPQLLLAKGSTFLSLVTNAIPRNLYPDKPDTGGVFLTKYYAGDAWEGLSNLTPTFLGEWIINFGWLAGILGFFLSYGAICFLILRWYVRLLRDNQGPRNLVFAIDVVIYVHLLWATVGLMPGEFTNIVLGFILTQLIPLLSLRYLVKWVVEYHDRRNLARVPAASRLAQ